jgi:serine/threonine protein kinase
VLICYSAFGEVRCDGKHLGWTRASLRVHSALSTSALAFLQACLEVDSHQRCSAEELSLHAFIVTDSTRAHTHTPARAHTHSHTPQPTPSDHPSLGIRFESRLCAKSVDQDLSKKPMNAAAPAHSLACRVILRSMRRPPWLQPMVWPTTA